MASVRAQLFITETDYLKQNLVEQGQRPTGV